LKMNKILILLLLTANMYSQNTCGTVLYSTKILPKKFKKNDSINSNALIISDIIPILKKGIEKKFLLEFCDSVSLQKDYLELDNNPSQLNFSNSNSEKLYSNTNQKKYLKEIDFIGKIFLINDNIPNYSWKIHTDSTKIILGHKCTKAIYINDKQQTITAWFTPNIKNSFGPKLYMGLPGLILELNDGFMSYISLEIDLKKRITIEPLTKGKIVTQKEFNIIVEKKKLEMVGYKDINFE